MNTAARPKNDEFAHWYYPNGQPCYEVAMSTKEGTRPATLRDARKLNLLPSVTNILRLLNKPQLNEWKTEQAVLAVLSTPRRDGEALDDFVHRVFHVEHVQDEEARKARELGTAIHRALEKAVVGGEYDQALADYIVPVAKWRINVGATIQTERVVVGDGYAGILDLLLDSPDINALAVVDFKTTGTLPDKSYLEHQLQTAAYAAAVNPERPQDIRQIITTNVYISTKNPGEFRVFSQGQDEWLGTYSDGFMPLMNLWRWHNKYWPTSLAHENPDITPKS